ncbi:MAG: CHAT domain-containing protein, partial [Cyanobacteria bacterium J06600_6]
LFLRIVCDPSLFTEHFYSLHCWDALILSFLATGVFIIYQDREPQYYESLTQETDLNTWIYENWLQPYQIAYDTKKLSSKKEKEQRKKQRQDWTDSSSVIMEELSQRLSLNHLIEEYLEGIEELIIIPHGYLHNIPFAALPISDTEYLNDRFRIRHAPSCQILKFCQDRTPVTDISYGTVEDADGSLAGARLEGQKVAQLFDISSENRLVGKEQSTVNHYRRLVRQVQGLHSAHHAISRLDNPLESALNLADGNITLGELLLWRLEDLDEVFLSCCESNLAIAEPTDDFLTLASGFLCAGARGVVSSLWVANDLSSILLSTFYYQLRKEGKSRSAALQQAQQKLRRLTGEELSKLFRSDLKPYKDLKKQELERKFKQSNKKRINAQKELEKLKTISSGEEDLKYWEKEKTRWQKIAKEHRQGMNNLEEVLGCKEEFPFANPYYWAVFICSGLA